MSKRTALLVLGVGILLLSTAALLARQQAQPPRALAALPQAKPAIPAHRLGVNAALELLAPAERAAALRAMSNWRLGWVRQRFPWDKIEPMRGQFNWQPWDEVVAAAAAQQIELVAVLDRAPAWARAAEDGPNSSAPPLDNTDFGRFAAMLAERYGATLRFYQVWDEPNIAPHWGNRWVNAAAYGALLREASIQIRAVDADAVIITAALAPNIEPGGANQSDVRFLEALYAAGAAPWFDAVAVQPYGFDRPADDPPSRDVLNLRRVELLRAVMLRRGDHATPIWLSSFGWHSDAARAAVWPAVTAAEQSRSVAAALQWAGEYPDWVAALGWPAWQAVDVGANDPRAAFALVDASGQPALLPVSDLFSTWVSQPFTAAEGRWPPTAALDAGGWRLTDEAGDIERDAVVNSLMFYFTGSTLALDVARGPYRGALHIWVDGKPANALPHVAGRASYLSLYDPLAQSESVLAARNLSPGRHTVEIHADGGWGQWPLLGFRVLAAPSPRSPMWLVWAVGLAGALAVALGSAGVSRRNAGRLGAHRAFLSPLPSPPAPLPGGEGSRDGGEGSRDGGEGSRDGGEGSREIGIAARTPSGSLSPWDRVRVRGSAFACLLTAIMLVALWLTPGPWPSVALALLALLFLLSPAAALFAVALSAPFFLHPIHVLGRAWSPNELLLWLAAAMAGLRWGVVALRSRSLHLPRWQWHALDAPVLALLGAGVLSLAAAQHLGVALHELRTVMMAGGLVYALVRLAPVDAAGRFDPWPLVWGLSLGATAAAGWGLAQALTGQGVIAAEGVGRVRGPYASPNNLALLLDHVWPLPLAVALFDRTRSRRVVAGLFAVVIFIGTVLTFSKGALLIGLPLTLLALGWLAGGRWRWAALALLALGALALLPLWRTERFADLFSLNSGTGLIRTQLWRGAMEMIQDRPWSGVGLDNFLYAYRTRYALPEAWQELNLSHPHNIVLDLWTRLGVAGLLAGLWLFVAAIRRAWQGRRHAAGADKALLAGVFVSLLVTLAHGLIDNSVFLVDLMGVMMLSVALAARLTAARDV